MAIVKPIETIRKKPETASVDTHLRRTPGWDPATGHRADSFDVMIEYATTEYLVDAEDAETGIHAHRVNPGQLVLSGMEFYQFAMEPITVNGVDTTLFEHLAKRIDEILQAKLG